MNRGRPRKQPEEAKPSWLEQARNTIDRWNENPDAGVETATNEDGEPTTRILGENKPLHAQLGQRELARGLRWLFIAIGKLPNIKSTAEFRESDFDEEAKALIDLINRFPVLRFLTRLLGPLSSISGFLDKWEQLIANRTVQPVRQPDTGKTVKWPKFGKQKPEAEQMFAAEESAS